MGIMLDLYEIRHFTEYTYSVNAPNPQKQVSALFFNASVYADTSIRL